MFFFVTIHKKLTHSSHQSIWQTMYALHKYINYMFKHSNMFWPISHLQGYHVIQEERYSRPLHTLPTIGHILEERV